MIEKIWSGKSGLYWLLIPFSLLYGVVSIVRRFCYKWGVFKSWKAAVPVVVVGNLTAGGNGKTPTVIWLAQQLQAKGIKVGVVSRGYGGKSDHYPLILRADTLPEQAGDEPVLIFRRTAAPVVVSPKRSEAVKILLEREHVQVILTDDGLQHYALARDMELVVVDGKRRFGNGWWLPAGPMRERAGRLKNVDAVIVNGGEAGKGEIAMQLTPGMAVNLVTGEQVMASRLPPVVAMAGIGYPARFFSTLAQLGVTVSNTVSFADHQVYSEMQLSALTKQNEVLLMTEKDAVKCAGFAHKSWWYLPVDATLQEPEASELIEKISGLVQSR